MLVTDLNVNTSNWNHKWDFPLSESPENHPLTITNQDQMGLGMGVLIAALSKLVMDLSG